MKTQFAVRMICCGRDAGIETFSTWDDADKFREAYVSGLGVGRDGHNRSAIVERISDLQRVGGSDE